MVRGHSACITGLRSIKISASVASRRNEPAASPTGRFGAAGVFAYLAATGGGQIFRPGVPLVFQIQSVILATMTDMQNSNPSWVQGRLPGARFDWENVDTGFGIACPPVGHFLILAPVSRCSGEDWRDRLLKLEGGEPLRFYTLAAAMEVADHIAVAWARDRTDAEFWRSEARRIEDED